MTDSRFLIVSIHGVAPPNWVQVEKILKHLWRLGVRKRSLLVIPNFRGCWRVDEYREFAEWLLLRHRPRTYSEFVRGWRKQTASLLAITQ